MELFWKNDKLFIWFYFFIWFEFDYLIRFWLFSLILVIWFDLVIWFGYLVFCVNLMRERFSNCGIVVVLELFVLLCYNVLML